MTALDDVFKTIVTEMQGQNTVFSSQTSRCLFVDCVAFLEQLCQQCQVSLFVVVDLEWFVFVFVFCVVVWTVSTTTIHPKRSLNENLNLAKSFEISQLSLNSQIICELIETTLK